jgi:membrane protein implicated in regulation of membrane protease activity
MPHIFMLMPLVALLLFVFLPWQGALALYIPIAIGSLAVARKVMPASGPETMIGDQAVVTAVGSQQAKVHYRGEIWRTVSS